MHDPLLVLDADLRVQSANESFYRTFQVTPKASEGRLIYDLGNRQWNIPKLRELLEDILPSKTVLNDFEVTHEFETIGERTMRLNARKLEAGEGLAPRILLGIRDITERSQAEKARRESEARFRLAFSNNMVAMGIWTKEGGIIDANDALLDLVGYTRQELEAGRINWVELTPPQYHERDLQAVVEVEADGVCAPYGKMYLHKDGREIPIVIGGGRFDEGAGIFFAIDIRERKKAEETLRESEERFRSLVTVITDVPWTTDAAGAFVTPQPAWAAYTGQTWEELRGFGWTNAVHPDDRERVKALWETARASHALYKSEGRLWHGPSQTWRHFEARATPLFRPDGSVREWVGTCTDVNDLKRAEEEQERLLKREHEARKQAETANQLKDEFLATISHELRTPLNAILGWAHILVRGKLDEANAAHGIEVIERNARAQNQLIADLLDISRIISGKFRFEQGAVELVSIIEAALETVRPAAEAKGVELRFVADPKAGLISGDANRLQQVVWNLLTNAVKYTPRNGQIEVELKRQGTSAAIVVQDSGEGIDPEFLPYIFDRFRQADGTTTRQHSGLGLGLAIVRQLVESHGGTVRAGSKGIGEGATFTVTLPLMAVRNSEPETGNKASDELENSKSEELQEFANLTDVKVLVVDDEPDARELLMLVLTQNGAEVRVAGTVDAALQILNEWKPDVLVSDIGMPQEDGYSLIRKVRALKAEAGGGIPAVALTGYATSDDNARALKAGYQVHMAKPVSPTELVLAVARLACKYDQVESS